MKCKSGRPLRSTFDGLIFWGITHVRVVDLKNAQDRIITLGSLKKKLGTKKYGRIFPEVELSGFYEHGDYRIEAWGSAHS